MRKSFSDNYSQFSQEELLRQLRDRLKRNRDRRQINKVWMVKGEGCYYLMALYGSRRRAVSVTLGYSKHAPWSDKRSYPTWAKA